MKKQLSEMSLTELWELFPIVLKEHNPEYGEWYNTERDTVLSYTKDFGILRVNHIGSTAVKGLIAKPTIDILLEVGQNCDIPRLIDVLKAQGWLSMSSQYNPELKLAFNKGYTPDGFAEKVFHLHVRHFGDWSELYFRDYLVAHPDVALAYGELKLSLLKAFKHDRDGYTEAKMAFIERYTKKAKDEFADRYKPLL
ncbi:MAG: GrpB family protein [Clostridiales bacterium]|jgi:GrpB-like predicted nucleotidyltransferase (UPF0157 family)|nr:GrpB family protein [Clostridiales bacterium]